MNVLICPVSRRRFTDPVVMSCGHTIERSCLPIHACPVCQVAVDNERVYPNLILKDLIDVGRYDAWTAREQMEKITLNDDVLSMLKKVITRMQYRSLSGENTCCYTYNTFFTSPVVMNQVRNILKERGFYTTHFPDRLIWRSIYISW